MTKFLTTLGLLFLTLSAVFAQLEEVDVVVHLKDGSTVEGLMKVNEMRPWNYQRSIDVYDKSLRGEDKIKKKQRTTYKAKSCKAMEYNGRYFEVKKVMLAGKGDMGSALKSLPKFAFIERIVEGEINVYKGYGYPPPVASGVTYDEIYEDLLHNPEYFLMKQPDGKVKSMHGADVAKWIEDSEVVSKKYDEGLYGNIKRKKGKKLGNFIKGQLDNENSDMIIQVIEDYNAEMAEK